MASAEKIITTITAEAGKNPGEAIGTYSAGKRWHIVFLPRDVQPGDRVRVELRELDKQDKSGRAMYRAAPTPEETIERWVDNNDGTASRVEILVDWRFSERQTGVIETRQLAARDGRQSTRSEYSVRWGQDLGSSRVEQLKISVTPLEVEQVENYVLAWKQTGTREEPLDALEHSILRVEVGYCQLTSSKSAVTIDPSWTVQLKAMYRPTNSSWDSTVEIPITWASSPAWWQVKWQVAHPICACGRQRYDLSNPDGFAKCELCRKEELCQRCGKQSGGVTNIAGRLVCSKCKSYEEQEQLIKKLIPVDVRRALAKQASAFLAADPILQGEAGEIVLKSTLDHITDKWNREHFTEKYSGYGWYYFCPDGVWASKFSLDALQVLAHLEHASGDGLVELIAWISGYMQPHKAAECESQRDYYYCAQILKQAVSPTLTEQSLGKLSVGVRLRGSEADRVAALGAHSSLTEKLGKESQAVHEVSAILSSREQNYEAALHVARKALADEERRQASIAAGEILSSVSISLAGSKNGRADEKVWAIAPDGSLYPNESSWHHATFGDLPTDTLIIRHGKSDYAYQYTEWWQVEYLPRTVTAAQREIVRRLEEEARVYFSGVRTGWKLDSKERVQVSTDYSRDFTVSAIEQYNEMCASFPIDVSLWHIVKETDTLVVHARRIDGQSSRTIIRQQSTSSTTPQVEVVQTVSVLWEQTNGRNIRCSHCGGTERMTKTQFLEFETGKAIVFPCLGCGRKGSVKRMDA